MEEIRQLHWFWTGCCSLRVCVDYRGYGFGVGGAVIPSLKHCAAEGGYSAMTPTARRAFRFYFAARDEAEKLPAALASFLALDYPNYEVIAVDDRSEDAQRQF